MGKQTTYYMDYTEFLTLAQAALDEGCSILRWGNAAEPPRPFRELSAIDPTHPGWYFLLPGAGELRFMRDRLGGYFLDTSGALETQLIETGFSVQSGRGVWGCARLYIQTNALVDGELIPRSGEATRIYDKLARLVRKMAPTRTYRLADGSTMKLHVSAAMAEKTGPDGEMLCAIHDRNHPLTPQEHLSLLQEMTVSASEAPLPDGPLHDAAAAFLQALPDSLSNRESKD